MGTPDVALIVNNVLEHHGETLLAEVPESDKSLEHYGVKGMRWGVRRSDKELARAEKKRKESKEVDLDGERVTVQGGGSSKKVVTKTKKASVVDSEGNTTDVVINRKTNRARTRAKESLDKDEAQAILDEFGVSALSNIQLQAYAKRVNLERQINELSPPKKSLITKFVESEQKTLVKSLMNNPVDPQGAIKSTNTAKIGTVLVGVTKKAMQKRRP